MYIFHDSALNLWRFHPGELPEKPIFNFNYYDQASTKAYDVKLYNYNAVIAAIRQNALTIGNPELIHTAPYVQLHVKFKPDEFYAWPGGYETKEILSNGWIPSYNDPDNRGFAPNAEPETVAILTLPEKKKNIMENDKIYIDGDFNDSYEARIQRSKGKRKNKNAKDEAASDSVAAPKITPERAKEVEDKKWSLSRMFNDDVLMFDGCISAITIEEICDKLNELESTRDQLAKQEVAFRETVKIQHEEIKQRDELIKDLLPLAKNWYEYLKGFEGWAKGGYPKPDWLEKLPEYESLIEKASLSAKTEKE